MRAMIFLPLALALAILLCLPMRGAAAEEIEYVEIGDRVVSVDGDFSARAVLTPKDPDAPNMEGGIRLRYREDMTYYAFFVRWTSSSRCDFYGSKYVAGRFMGFLIAEEYEETRKDCFVSVDDAWDATDDESMTLTVSVRGDLATVTMTGDRTGYGATLHFDLTKSAWLDGRYSESSPEALRGGILKKALRGGAYQSFAVDRATYAGDTIAWPEEETRAADANRPFVDTPLGTFAPGALSAGTYKTDSASLPFMMYLPEHYDLAASYPLVLFLHGDGSRGMDNRQPTDSSEFILAREIMARGTECVIVAPQTPVSWVRIPADDNRAAHPSALFTSYSYQEAKPSKYLNAAFDLVAAIKETMPIDASRVYLYGYSRGAFAGYYLLAAYPDDFAAAILCAGVGCPDKADVIARTPVYVFHGTADDVVSFADDKALIEAVASAGGDTVFKPCAGLAHSISGSMRRDADNVLNWLFARTK